MAKEVTAQELFTRAMTGSNVISRKQANMLIKSTGKRLSENRQAIQAVAVAAIVRSWPNSMGGNRDTSKAIQLLTSLDSKPDQRALMAFFECYSNIIAKFNATKMAWSAKLREVDNRIPDHELPGTEFLLKTDYRSVLQARQKPSKLVSDQSVVDSLNRLIKKVANAEPEDIDLSPATLEAVVKLKQLVSHLESKLSA